MEKTLQEILVKLAALEKGRQVLENLAEGQKALEKGQEALRRDVGGLKQGQEALRSDVTGLKDTVQNLKQGQEALRSDVTGLKDTVQNLKQGQEALRSDVTGLKDTVQNLKQGQDALAKRQDEAHQLLRALEEHTQVTRAVVIRIDETLPYIQGDIAHLKEVSANTQERLDDLNLNVEYALLQLTKQAAQIQGIKRQKLAAK